MTDKPPIDEQWDELVNDWQSQPYEKVDTDALVKKLKKRTRGAKLMLLCNVLGTIAIFSVFIWSLVKQDPDHVVSIFSGVGGLLSLIYTVIEIKIRTATWKMDATDPEQVFNKTLSSLKGSVQYAKLWLFNCYLLIPGINWFLWEIGKTSEKDMLVGYLLANSINATFIIGGLIYQKRRKAELVNLQSFLSSSNKDLTKRD